jgi:hypothetical protein
MTQLDPTQFVNTAAPGRECGTCTLCCKVYDVPSLAKPAGKWCQHCLPGKGCGIHATRPDHCRSFFCLWMTDGTMPTEWKPERSKLVLSIEPATRFINVQVDPGSPSAWRTEPFYSQLKSLAAQIMPEQRFVMIFINKSATVLLPDKDVPLGVIGDGDELIPYRQVLPGGVSYAFDVRRGAN